jgi:hypothetical protein
LGGTSLGVNAAMMMPMIMNTGIVTIF